MFTKIKNEDFKDKDVSSITANPLLGDATINKALFDRAAKEVLMPAINRLIDELLDTNAPKHIGAEGGTLEELLNGLKKSLSDVPGTIDEKVATAIAQVVADAPASLDTLKELSDWINTHAESAAKMNSAIEDNRKALEDIVNKKNGMGLSENNYSDEEKEKVSEAYEHSRENHAPSNAEKNAIISIKRNGTALTPDANREVDIKVPTKTSELTNDSEFIQPGDNTRLNTLQVDNELLIGGHSLSDDGFGVFCVSGDVEDSYLGLDFGAIIFNGRIGAKTNSDDDDNSILELYDDWNATDYITLRGVGTPVADNDAANKEYVDNIRKWKFIKNDTLTEGVASITVNFDDEYKELYVRMVVPTMISDEMPTVSAGKVTVYANKYATENCVLKENSTLFTDTTGESLNLNYHVRMVNKHCNVQRQHSYGNRQANASAATNNTFSGYTDMGQEYLESLVFVFSPTPRVFPAGTTFEIWGVKA